MNHPLSFSIRKTWEYVAKLALYLEVSMLLGKYRCMYSLLLIGNGMNSTQISCSGQVLSNSNSFTRMLEYYLNLQEVITFLLIPAF